MMKSKILKISIILLKLIIFITPVLANLIFTDPVKEIAFDVVIEVAGAGSISMIMGSSLSKTFISLLREMF